MTREQTSYLADQIYQEASIKKKSLPWLELIERSGIQLLRPICSQSVQQAIKADEGYSTFTALIQEYLPPRLREERKDFSIEMLYWHPNYKFQRHFRFCDKIHFSLGKPQTKKIKRRIGERHHDRNTQFARPEKVAPDQKGSIHFALMGYNYIRAIPYKNAVSNGKMDAYSYKDLLTQILSDIEGYILYKDKDSAHNAAATKAWKEEHGMAYVIAPGKSLDFSCLETEARPIRRMYNTRRILNQARAEKWAEECICSLNKKSINKLFEIDLGSVYVEMGKPRDSELKLKSPSSFYKKNQLNCLRIGCII